MKRRTFAQPQKNVPSIQKQLYNFIKKETLTQVFSCEFCEILKSTFLIEHLPTTASISYIFDLVLNTPLTWPEIKISFHDYKLYLHVKIDIKVKSKTFPRNISSRKSFALAEKCKIVLRRLDQLIICSGNTANSFLSTF